LLIQLGAVVMTSYLSYAYLSVSSRRWIASESDDGSTGPSSSPRQPQRRTVTSGYFDLQKGILLVSHISAVIIAGALAMY
jgi:hypothetical protein